jgi:hypothetical protein
MPCSNASWFVAPGPDRQPQSENEDGEADAPQHRIMRDLVPARESLPPQQEENDQNQHHPDAGETQPLALAALGRPG